MPTSRVPAAVVAVLTVAAVIACGPSASGGQHPPAQTGQAQHDAADVAFAQNMIPHHQQAVDMSAMVSSHTSNPRMQVMARDISSDQTAEIHSLSILLTKWGEAPAMRQGGMPGMQGMVDPATMNQLASLDGPAFDTLWMRSMVGHHQGAVKMAQDEIAHGQSQDAISMAENIITNQQREIAYMTHLLSSAQ